MIHDAIELADMGLSVIPLKPCAKVAATSWKRYQSERASSADVALWWDKEPAHNVGIVTGAISGIVVLDADDLEAVTAVLDRGVPDTPNVQTRRGVHWYFRCPDVAVRGTTRLSGIEGHVDLRADGNYVVAPPSVHESGHVYSWNRSPNDVEFAECPDWLMALLQVRRDVQTIRRQHLKAREAWHGGEPGIADLSVPVRRAIFEGDHHHEWLESGKNQTHRVASRIVGGCAERGLGSAATIAILDTVIPPPENDGFGMAWYRIQVATKDRFRADREVERKYADVSAMPNVVAAWEVRDELRKYRNQILSAHWSLREHAALKVLCAVLAISWEAATFTPDTPTRRIAELANIDSSAACRRLHSLADDGWFDLYGHGRSLLTVDLRMGPSEASSPYTSASSLYGAKLHAALHPAFGAGTNFNVLVWMALGDEPRSTSDIAKQLRTTPRTVQPHLQRFVEHGLANRGPRSWATAGDHQTLNAAAVANGGEQHAKRRRDKIAQERARQSESREAAGVPRAGRSNT